MKEKRQRAIVDLVKAGSISSQSDLREALIKMGFSVTQATLSRDLKELNVVKVASSDGEYKYTFLAEPIGPQLLSCESSGNLIVLRTGTGMAPAVALLVDALRKPWLLGCVAGDDTILVVVAEGYESGSVKAELLKGVLEQ